MCAWAAQKRGALACPKRSNLPSRYQSQTKKVPVHLLLGAQGTFCRQTTTDWSSAHAWVEGLTIGNEGHDASNLNGPCELALLLRACTADAARHNLSVFRNKASQQLRILVIKCNVRIEHALWARIPAPTL